jgi:exodeoxyribonuclease-5
MAASARDFEATLRRIAGEASNEHIRWADYHRFRERFAVMQGIPALTVHNSQGSTFRNVFIDVPDIRRRMAGNLLECQQLFYTAFTRPTHAVMLAGV